MESRLLALPYELRLQIYENVLICKSTSFRIRPKFRGGAGDSPHNTKFRSQVSPALLRSCRQVNEEATRILYSKNCFLAASAGGLILFLCTIRRNAKFLRWLKVRLGDSYSSMHSTWGDGFLSIASHATGLTRLEIGYMESMHPDRDMRFLLQHGLGRNTRTARVMGGWITEMRNLKTLMISGFYGKNWPAFLPRRRMQLSRHMLERVFDCRVLERMGINIAYMQSACGAGWRGIRRAQTICSSRISRGKFLCCLNGCSI